MVVEQRIQLAASLVKEGTLNCIWSVIDFSAMRDGKNVAAEYLMGAVCLLERSAVVAVRPARGSNQRY